MKHISEVMQEAISPKEQVLTVWKPSENGSLSTVTKGVQMWNLENPEPIKQALRYAFTLVGLRGQNLPDEYEKEILIKFIVTKYGGHTAAEIRLAFEKAVSGELDIDATCYENFSVLYFSRIMNAYRK